MIEDGSAYLGLLAHLPEPQRGEALRDVADSLQDTRDLEIAGQLWHALKQFPDHKAEKSVFGFLLTERDTIEGSTALASFCANDSEIRDRLVDRTTSDLARLLQIATSPSTGDHDEVTSPNYLQIQARRHCFHYLKFVSALCVASKANREIVLSAALWREVFIALSSTDYDIVRTSRAILSWWVRALLARTDNSNSAAKLAFCNELWIWINATVGGAESKFHRTVALSLWAAWLDLVVNHAELSDELNRDEYWQRVQAAMASEDMEVRKLGILILRKSLDVCHVASLLVKCAHLYMSSEAKISERVRSDFDRYCAVFETMVLARYINQIKECKDDLDRLISPTSHVPRSWLLVLLHAALSKKMQESIQSFTGNWILQSRIASDEHAEGLGRLLEESVLPWATRGPSFTHSITGKNSTSRCEHGDILCDYIEQLLLVDDGSGKPFEARQIYLSSILRYLRLAKYNLMPYAIVYILRGVFLATCRSSDLTLTQDELNGLADLPAVHGLPEAVQCLLTFYTASIASKCSGDKSASTSLNAVGAFSSPVTSLGSSTWTSLDALCNDIEDTRCACLTGHGLIQASWSVTALLQNSSGPDPAKLLRVLDAVWDETEIQDYPKRVLVLLPAIWLHKEILEAALLDTDIADRLARFVETFLQMSRSRIYVWTPFAVALRQAALSVPSIEETLGLQALITSVARNAPTARPEFALDAAVCKFFGLDTTLDMSYQHFYGEYASVGFAAIFDLTNRVAAGEWRFCKAVLDDLLDPWIDQKVPVPVSNKWKRTEQLQLILILLENEQITRGLDIAEHYFNGLLYLTKVEPLPRFRFLLEWAVSRLLLKHAQLRGTLLQQLASTSHHGHPRYVASLIKLAVTFACSSGGNEDFASTILGRLVALAASSKIMIRHEAQWHFPIFWAHALKSQWTSVVDNSALHDLIADINALDKSFEVFPERSYGAFVLDTDHDLANLLYGNYHRLEPPAVPLLGPQDILRLASLDQEAGFDADALYTRALPLADRKNGPLNTAEVKALPYNGTVNNNKSAKADVALQTKGSSYVSNVLVASKADRPHPNLHVVASLVDNPFNLGGISRVSEIFGAGKLYMANVNVTSNKDFESVAVTSQHHMELSGLPIAELAAFFGKCRADGFRIVGIEQTDRSKMLGHETTRLPEKIVLVLGAEREGMPAMILAECDLLVEVPQRGVTRSMNVQTALGCILYEYCRQHR